MTAKPIEIKLKVDIVPWAEASPLQKTAWERLWSILLKESQDKATNSTAQK